MRRSTGVVVVILFVGISALVLIAFVAGRLPVNREARFTTGHVDSILYVIDQETGVMRVFKEFNEIKRIDIPEVDDEDGFDNFDRSSIDESDMEDLEAEERIMDN